MPLFNESNQKVLKFFAKFLTCIFFACGATFSGITAASAACASNQIDVTGDGTNCQDAKFTLTTTDDIADGGVFKFYMSAAGTFYVDCGANGSLSGTGVSGKTINRTGNTTGASYTCTYSVGGAKTLKFGGLATGYPSSGGSAYAAISFSYNSTPTLVKTISGSLGAIFSTFGSSITQQPQFRQLFNGCSNLESVPGTLFKGVTGGINGMFATAFKDCAKLTSIPTDLFSGITTCYDSLFADTFRNCTGLTAIPPDLFKNLSNCASNRNMNYSLPYIFNGCTNIKGYIPPSTFKGLIDAGHPTYTNAWLGSFTGTQLVKTCPDDTTEVTTGYKTGPYSDRYWNGLVSCKPKDPIAVTLDSTGANTNVNPSIIYLKYYAGWYSDAAGTISISSLTTTPTKAGETFLGFYTGQNGTGYQIIDNNGNLSSDSLGFTIDPTTIYARFGTAYTVAYSCGGESGTQPANGVAVSGESFTPAANTCSKTGHTFAGWAVSGTNDVKTAGTAFTWNYSENKTLTATWTPTVYTISYTMNGGTNYSGYPTSYTYGTGATINGTPTRTGYTFAGWCTDSGLTTCAMTQTISTTDTGNKTFYAKWTANQYTVTYSCGDGTGTKPADTTATYGSSFTPAANTCSKTEHTFAGWTVSGTSDVKTAGTGFTWNYTQNKTLTAKWTVNTYNITLNNISEVPSGYTHLEYLESTGTQWIDTGYIPNQNTTFRVKVNMTQATGYVIVGYYVSADEMFRIFNFNQQIYFDINNTGSGYTRLNGGSFTNNVTYDFFVGNRYVQNYETDSILLGSKVNNPEIWTGTQTIKILPDNAKGKVYLLQIWENDLLLHNYIPAKRNSDNVLGMYDTVTNTFKTNAGSGTFTAGPVTNIRTYTYGTGTTIDSTTAGTRDGYTFAGWCTDSALTNCAMTQTIGTSDTGDKTFYAKWTANASYTVTYACGTGATGNPPTSETVVGGTSFTPADNNTCAKTGYTFDGWNDGTTDRAVGESFTWNYSENKTFTAKWTETTYSCSAGTYLRGSDATCQACPAGYFCGGVSNVTNSGSDQGKTSCSTATSGLYTQSAASATTQDQCYRDCTTDDIAYSSAVTGIFYADLTNTCEVSTCSTGYNLQPSNTDLLTVIGDTNGITKAATNSSGGTRSGDTSKYGIYGSPQAFAVDYGEKGVLKGHAFCSTTSGSTDNDTWENPSTSETRPGSAGQYCWCHAEEYIPYGGESQSVSAPWIYIYDYGYNASNYCADWCAGNLSTMSPAFRSAVLRTANIESLNGGSCLVASYNITYELDGGTNYNNAPTTYTYGTGATINGTPTKSGYTFAGWCTDSALTNCAMTQTIGTDATGDKTFYAKWTANASYTVTYACGTGATGNPPTSETVVGGTSFTPADNNTCAKTGYTFDGWNDGTTDRAVGESFTWNYSENKTFTAQWTANTYNITLNNISEVPSEYTQLEYLEGTGSQWLCTDIHPSLTMVSQIGIKMSTYTGYVIYGFYNSANAMYRLFNYKGSMYLDIDNDTTGRLIGNNMFQNNVYYDLEIGNRYVKNLSTNTTLISGDAFSSFSWNAQNYNMCLFSSSGTNTIGSGKIYYIKVYDNNILAYNYIPAKRNSDNVLGMYDTVNNVFKTNAGSGTFTAGDPVLGSTTSTYTYGVGDTIDSTDAGTRDGYTFAGWCTDSALTNCAMTQTIGTSDTGDKTFYAKWTENSSSPAVYNITYTMNDGTNYSGAPETYTVGTGATINGVPTKSGYVFAGWCTDSGLTTCAMTQTIDSEATGDKTFYAKWTQCQACAGNTGVTCSMSVVNNVCTYTTACDTGYENIQDNGTYNASCTANETTYSCSAGTYLRGSDATCQACPAGYFCGGVSNVTNSGSDQGKTSCSTATSGLYTQSAASATTQDQCYRDCTTDDIAYSSAVTGIFYADLTNTCEVSTCSTGYSLTTPSATVTLPDSSTAPSSRQYRSHMSNGSTSNSDNDLVAGEWKDIWTTGDVQGTLKGIASCNSTSGNHNSYTWNNDSSNWLRSSDTFTNSANGRYCWCMPTSWTPSGRTEQSLSAAWVFYSDYGGASSCAGDCAYDCASIVNNYAGFRSALFGVVGASGGSGGPATCEPNTYNITYVMNDGTNYNNAPATYTYGTGATINGTPTKSGYTFAGWCTDSALTNCAMTQTIGTTATGDKTFYAKWTAVAATEYNITYVMDGGTNYNNAPATYTYGTGATINGTPTKSGYTFAGWCTDSGLTSCNTTQTISASDTGDKTFYAKWTANTYSCSAGTYLRGSDATCQACPAGYFCGGVSDVTNSGSDQGKTSCSTATSGLYTQSAASATTQDQCYRDCTTDDIAYSSAVTGIFYADLTNTCEVSTCSTGYSLTTPSVMVTLPNSSTGPSSRQYRSHVSNGYTSNSDNDLVAGEWKDIWTTGTVQGTLKGIASCNSTSGNNNGFKWNNDSSNWLRSSDTFSNSANGQYCWCMPTSWTPSGGTGQSLSAAWVFNSGYGGASACARYCANVCASDVNGSAGFRSAVLGVVGASGGSGGPATCEPNSITINWGDGESESCSYGEELTVPATPPTRRGYTFVGWTFE